MEYTKLSNGIEMPLLGYGVYQIPEDEAERCVSDALSIGYWLIDTAQGYFNEAAVGAAINKSGIDRKDIFLVDKIFYSQFGYEKAKRSIEDSLKKLNTGYIDLMLLHQPFGDYYGAYRAMEEFVDKGLIKSIGVSNFSAERFIDLYTNARIKPVINQCETHVFNQQTFLHDILNEYGARLMAWSPFAEGKNDFFSNETLAEIGKKYGKTGPQVALRYMIQSGIIVIPKSTHKERMQQNFDIFDFKLDKSDIEAISLLDERKALIVDYSDINVTKWFMKLMDAPIDHVVTPGE